ncbi:hypothetical protein SEA_ALONE_49 [Streptomyces phage Alone3]|nr:hypothetical protein SEA_ALONE_49 [Streptomyces phage Alone3]
MPRGHQETQRVPGMSRKAPDPVSCARGGKHTPSTHEKKVDGQHVKYVICTKCHMIP